jgi:hypothetical protein
MNEGLDERTGMRGRGKGKGRKKNRSEEDRSIV